MNAITGTVPIEGRNMQNPSEIINQTFKGNQLSTDVMGNLQKGREVEGYKTKHKQGTREIVLVAV